MRNESAMGQISRINGYIIEAKGIKGARMNSKVQIGKDMLIGEIIKIDNDRSIIQVFENTDGLMIGDTVTSDGNQMTAALAPGLIGMVYDGLQRPLSQIGDFIERGLSRDAIDLKRKWPLEKVKDGKVKKGDLIAKVKETDRIDFRIFAPSDGKVSIKEGEYQVDKPFGHIETDRGRHDLTMLTRWPIYTPRPYKERHSPKERLMTGMRVVDTMFPLTKGGCAGVPGGFGCGKTVITQSIAKYTDVDIVIMALVGERGNECADVLSAFPDIKDEKTGRSIMERSIIIANTSNMPVSARISSIYLATSIGEFYRDMGYDVLMITDSTSRWAEAIREISGMLEEMPGDEGYPAYLASRISSFYERSGKVTTLEGNEGSFTIIGAVSPPGGDFSEPVTQATKSIVRSFWALSPTLAYSRHYPAIDWLDSYSDYIDSIEDDDKDFDGWKIMRDQMMDILQKEKELEKVVRLVGYEGLSDPDRFLLKIAELFRENYLQQSALNPVDVYCSSRKQYEMLKIFTVYYDLGLIALRHGKGLDEVLEPSIKERISSMKFEKKDVFSNLLKDIEEKMIGAKKGIDLDDLLDDGELDGYE